MANSKLITKTSPKITGTNRSEVKRIKQYCKTYEEFLKTEREFNFALN